MSPYAFYQFWLNVEDDEGRRAAAGLHLPDPRRRSRTLEAAARREAVPAGRPAGARRARDHAGARRRGDRADQGGRPRRCSVAATCRELERRPPWRAALREAGATAVDRADGLPTVVDLLVDAGLVARARARPGARSPRAAPTSTTSGSRTPSYVPDRGRPPRRRLAGAAARQEELRRASRSLTVSAERGGSTGCERARRAALLPEPVLRYVRQGARDGVTAAEAVAAWDRRPVPPARAARRHRRSTCDDRCSARRCASPFGRRADHAAARGPPRRRGRDGRGPPPRPAR